MSWYFYYILFLKVDITRVKIKEDSFQVPLFVWRHAPYTKDQGGVFYYTGNREVPN
jgi:hypothetical protein